MKSFSSDATKVQHNMEPATQTQHKMEFNDALWEEAVKKTKSAANKRAKLLGEPAPKLTQADYEATAKLIMTKANLQQRTDMLKPATKLLTKQEKKQVNEYREELYWASLAEEKTAAEETKLQEDWIHRIPQLCAKNKNENEMSNVLKARKFYELSACLSQFNARKSNEIFYSSDDFYDKQIQAIVNTICNNN